ncbi:ATP dependent DNA ligase [Rhizobium yanglingense]
MKIKCIQSDGFAIVGYEHSFVARAGIASLLLGARHGRKLIYVGSVGTGFSERTARELREALDKLKAKKPPVEYSGRRKYIVWVKPTLIAEVEYRGWTHDWQAAASPIKG